MRQQDDGDIGKWRALLRAAPRRYRLPPLPSALEAAVAAGVETAIAFALEALRLQQATPAVRTAFTDALAGVVRRASEADAVFQAQVLRARDAEVAEFAGCDPEIF